MKLFVYVPAPDSHLAKSLLPASAVVGTPVEGGSVLVDFEGNRYGAENLKTFEERLLHAAGRHEVRYPTVARRLVPATEVIPVGTYDTQTHRLDVVDEERLSAWLG